MNRKNKENPSKNKTMIIGSYNVFEVGCKIDSCDIGDFNTFEPRCFFFFYLFLNLKDKIII
jgi:hypothetical protein